MTDHLTGQVLCFGLTINAKILVRVCVCMWVEKTVTPTQHNTQTCTRKQCPYLVHILEHCVVFI